MLGTEKHGKHAAYGRMTLTTPANSTASSASPLLDDVRETIQNSALQIA